MTRMEDLQDQLDEQARQDAVYQASLQRIARERLNQERRGFVAINAIMGTREAALGNGLFAKLAHGAKLFCIGFAFAAAPALAWMHLL